MPISMFHKLNFLNMKLVTTKGVNISRWVAPIPVELFLYFYFSEKNCTQTSSKRKLVSK